MRRADAAAASGSSSTTRRHLGRSEPLAHAATSIPVFRGAVIAPEAAVARALAGALPGAVRLPPLTPHPPAASQALAHAAQAGVQLHHGRNKQVLRSKRKLQKN